MISASHWGMFPQPQPVLLMPSGWSPTHMDVKPGEIIRINGQPHKCIAVLNGDHIDVELLD